MVMSKNETFLDYPSTRTRGSGISAADNLAHAEPVS